MEWMVWTLGTGLFFTGIFAMLGFMTFIDLRNPTLPRKGFLPMVTTRGDRLYVSVMGCAFILLAWIGLSEFTFVYQILALAMCAAFAFVTIRWG